MNIEGLNLCRIFFHLSIKFKVLIILTMAGVF